MLQAATYGMSPEEYLDWQNKSPIRHEYRCGQLWAMGGGTYAHGLVTGALHIALGNHLKGGPCRVVQSELMVEVGVVGGTAYYYPDLVVLCRPPAPDATHVDNPTVLVEVFSPSTEALDRKRKWEDYARIPTLRAYVLANPETPILLVRRREGPKGEWRTEALGPEDDLALPSLEFRCPVVALYEGLDG